MFSYNRITFRLTNFMCYYISQRMHQLLLMPADTGPYQEAESQLLLKNLPPHQSVVAATEGVQPRLLPKLRKKNLLSILMLVAVNMHMRNWEHYAQLDVSSEQHC